MEDEEPDRNKIAVEKMEGGLIQIRKGFSELRAKDITQTEALEGMNIALYKLDTVFSDLIEAFKGE